MQNRIVQQLNTTTHLPGNNSLISYFKHSTKLCDKDVLTLVGDMILAGIDTSSYTFSFLSYLLSKNPNVQDKLRTHIEEGSTFLINFNYKNIFFRSHQIQK